MAKMEVFTYNNLALYDELLKGYISAEDAKSIKTVAVEGNVLKFYKVEEPVGETAPAYTVELPEADLSGLIEKLQNATAGNVVIANADGTIADGGVALADLATKEEVRTVSDKADANATAIETINNADTGILATAKAYADAEVKELADGAVKTNTDAIAKLNGDASTEGSVAKAVKDSADAINAVIGEVGEGQTVMGIIQNIQENAYDDTEIRGLIQDNADAIQEHKDSIDGVVTTLVGEDANKSVRTIANEELAKQLIAEGAAESLDTLQEIAAWIQSHPEDASAMSKAIDDLEALVGTLPEGVTATDIVGYIQEVVGAEKTRAEGIESGLDTRLTTVETAIAEGGSVDLAIKDAKKAGTDASAAVTALETGKVADNATAISNLQTLVGDGYEEISEDKIRALFA